MFKHFAYALPLLVCLGAAGVVVSNTAEPRPHQARMATDGAFRDGLYMGRFAAKTGRPYRPLIGRWSEPGARASFGAGYELGYKQALASTNHNQ
jgi:hypothetical protein